MGQTFLQEGRYDEAEESLSEAWTFMSQVEFSSLWVDEWSPRFGDFSLKAIVLSSVYVTGIAMVVLILWRPVNGMP